MHQVIMILASYFSHAHISNQANILSFQTDFKNVSLHLIGAMQQLSEVNVSQAHHPYASLSKTRSVISTSSPCISELDLNQQLVFWKSFAEEEKERLEFLLSYIGLLMAHASSDQLTYLIQLQVRLRAITDDRAHLLSKISAVHGW